MGGANFFWLRVGWLPEVDGEEEGSEIVRRFPTWLRVLQHREVQAADNHKRRCECSLPEY